jgi:MFS transporter, PAT family, beta-lactamase induction signal transducer AmpG
MALKERLEARLGAAAVYLDRRILAIFFLGFSSGLPIMLVLATLTAWLNSQGVSKSMIGLFAYVLTPYTLKFVWAPIMDRVPLPVLTALLGRRRSWMLLSQLGLMAAILGLAATDPGTSLATTAAMAVLVAFMSASQDIVIDAYRIEILEEERLGAGAAVVVLGYRIAMWVATTGALAIAYFWGYPAAYTAMALLVPVGIVTVLLNPEPAGSRSASPRGEQRLLAWLDEVVAAPFKDFFARNGRATALVILAFISLYKASDVLIAQMAFPFYQDVGFNELEIGWVSGTFGLFCTFLGSFLMGAMIWRFGIIPGLFFAGLLQMSSNLMFALQAWVGRDLALFHLTIFIENTSGGMGTTAFVAYLSSLCNIRYTAVQYALLTSFMQVLGKFVITPSSGFLVDAVGWIPFFLISSAAGIPALLLLLWLWRRIPVPAAMPAPAPPGSG